MKSEKIMLKLITTVFFLSAGLLYSQEKIFLPTEDVFVTVIGYEDDINPDILYYCGKYTYIWPGMDANGQPEGDAFRFDYVLTLNSSNEIDFYKSSMTEGFGEETKETYSDISINENKIRASYEFKDTTGTTGKIICSGKFVYLKYKTKNGEIKSSKGLYFKGWEDYEAVFYEKQK